jgi:DNA-binding beta-propeller fold protein YncE
VRATLDDCHAIDRWTFPVGRSQVVDISVDTLSASTAADLCFKGRCGGLDLGGDDEIPCTAAPPAFACPHTAATTRRRGICTIDVSSCSDECARSPTLEYLLTVSVAGGGPQVDSLLDDVAETGPLCTDGTNDGQPCTGAIDCPDGTCTELPPAPPRGQGDLPSGTDVPVGADLGCNVSVVMQAQATYGTLKYKLGYAGASGGFPGLGKDVDCTRNAGGFSSFIDQDAARVLTTTLFNSEGVDGPLTLTSCPFATTESRLDASSFHLAITDARTPADDPLEPGLEVRVHCDGETTTTVAGASTTTLGGTTVPGQTTTTVAGQTTTTVAPASTLPGATTTTVPDVPCGSLLTKWGLLGNGNGQFNAPVAVAADVDRRALYVMDRTNSRVQRFDLAGAFARSWGKPGSDPGEFSGASDVAVDFASGDVYVADTNNNRIEKFDAAGKFLTQWGMRGSADGQFDEPAGVAVDSVGNVYVSDRANARVQKFDSDGAFLAKFGTLGTAQGQFQSPEGIAVGENDNVFVADSRRDRILKFDDHGNPLAEFGSRGTGPGQFTRPFDVFVERSGDVFVADTGRSRIQKLDSAGNFVAQWGSFGRADGQLDDQRSITGVGEGVVFVADTGNNRVQKFRCR